MNKTKKQIIHCAIVRIDHRNEEINKQSIAKEIKQMRAEYDFGVLVDICEELQGMEPAEIKAEQKKFAKYFKLFE